MTEAKDPLAIPAEWWKSSRGLYAYSQRLLRRAFSDPLVREYMNFRKSQPARFIPRSYQGMRESSALNDYLDEWAQRALRQHVLMCRGNFRNDEVDRAYVELALIKLVRDLGIEAPDWVLDPLNQCPTLRLLLEAKYGYKDTSASNPFVPSALREWFDEALAKAQSRRTEEKGLAEFESPVSTTPTPTVTSPTTPSPSPTTLTMPMMSSPWPSPPPQQFVASNVLKVSPVSTEVPDLTPSWPSPTPSHEGLPDVVMSPSSSIANVDEAVNGLVNGHPVNAAGRNRINKTQGGTNLSRGTLNNAANGFVNGPFPVDAARRNRMNRPLGGTNLRRSTVNDAVDGFVNGSPPLNTARRNGTTRRWRVTT